MNNPTFDLDGYPTEETLEHIRKWCGSWSDWFDFIEEAWSYDDPYFRRENGKVSMSTGGWSGNEEIIGAMMDNHLGWMLCWELSSKGGHYEFVVYGEKQ